MKNLTNFYDFCYIIKGENVNAANHLLSVHAHVNCISILL